MALNFSISSILSNSPTNSESIKSEINSSPEPQYESHSNDMTASYQTLLTALNWQAYGYLSNLAQTSAQTSTQESPGHDSSPNGSFNSTHFSPPATPVNSQQQNLMPPHWSQKQQGHEAGVLRRRYTAEQTRVLMEKYKETRYVPRQEMAVLASATGLTMLQVKIWFQNRRLKDRKKLQKSKSRSQSPELEV